MNFDDVTNFENLYKAYKRASKVKVIAKAD